MLCIAESLIILPVHFTFLTTIIERWVREKELLGHLLSFLLLNTYNIRLDTAKGLSTTYYGLSSSSS